MIGPVEKNVPFPGKGNGKRVKDMDFPWNTMEVGDSFVYERGSAGGLKKAARAAGIEVEIRGVPESQKPNGPYGGNVFTQWRVWRVK